MVVSTCSRQRLWKLSSLIRVGIVVQILGRFSKAAGSPDLPETRINKTEAAERNVFWRQLHYTHIIHMYRVYRVTGALVYTIDQRPRDYAEITPMICRLIL